MMKGFQHTGFWWHPNKPTERWPGTLTFDPIDGATLALTTPFHPSQIFAESQEFAVLHGETTGGLEITLLNCFGRSSTQIFANSVISGFHADQPDPPVLVAAAVIENLAEWWGLNALAHEPEVKFPNIGIRYTQPAAKEVHASADMRVSICSSPLASFGRKSISVEEEIRIEVTASQPRPLSVFQRCTHACQDLLSIAALSLCKVEELRLSPPSEAGQQTIVGNFYAVPVFKNPAEDWPDYLFRYVDIAGRLPEVFGAWLGNSDSLSTVRSLYMSGAYGKSFLEIKLLALAQAIEAYHRRVYGRNDLYMEARDYEQNILPGLLAAIPETLDASHRQALRNRLKFGNEFSFRKRLTMLVDEHETALAALVPTPRTWIEMIVNYRNALTHHPVVEDRADVDKIELIRCNYVLRTLLEFCFLKSMAFDSQSIVALAQRCTQYQQIRRRFFAGAI